MFRNNNPRRLREEDVVGFYEAAHSQRGPMNREQIIAALEKKNSYRMWRLRHDYKWVRRQMKKMGLNPDDARELL